MKLFTTLAARSCVERSVLAQRPIRNVEQIVIKPTAQHPALLRSNVTVDNFKKLKLRDDVVNTLNSLNITQPTVIQMLAIPQILRGKNVLCAAETGSGKTITYIAPLISRLKDEEQLHGVITRLRRPRALIILPTRDLASQVLSVTKSFCHFVKLRAVGFIGGRKRRFIKDALTKPVDIAIATPDSFLRYRREERISLTDLSHLVIDEADTLFDDSFEDSLAHIMNSIKIRKAKPKLYSDLGEDTQITVVSASVSNKMLTKLSREITNLKKVSSKNLHQILPHVEQRFIKVNSHKKADHLLQLLKDHFSIHTIVFCNTVPSCDWTAHFLESNGIPVIKLHAGLNALSRQSRLKEFTEGSSSKILVCTDIASRGIDSTQVALVVQFDWPNTISDYLHRLGRTGRVSMMQKCCVVSFMTRRRDVRMAWMIKDAADRREVIMNKKVSKSLNIM